MRASSPLCARARGGDLRQAGLFCFLKTLSEVRMLTTFYLAKNDHRWVTFISLNTIKAADRRLRGLRSCLRRPLEHLRQARALPRRLGFGLGLGGGLLGRRLIVAVARGGLRSELKE